MQLFLKIRLSLLTRERTLDGEEVGSARGWSPLVDGIDWPVCPQSQGRRPMEIMNASHLLVTPSIVGHVSPV